MGRAALASICVALVLVAGKAVGYALTGSVALMGSLLDSGLDAAASLINFIAIRQAVAPPDKEHRFGHGKAEALAGLGQAALILGSAGYLAFESMGRLLSPRPVTETGTGVAILVASLGLTVLLVLYQRHVARKTGSLAVKADHAHYLSDLLMNAGVIAALILSGLGWLWMDGAIGLAVAGLIGWTGAGILRRAAPQLMDRELPDVERARVEEIIRTHPDVLAFHDLRTRQAGLNIFIQVHLDLERSLPLHRAHAIGDEVESRLLKEFPYADVLIHHDPVPHPGPVTHSGPVPLA